MSYKTYDGYKDSYIDWIDLIPNHWHPYKLKHVVSEFVAGGTPKSSNDSFWSEDNNGIPWVAIGDMSENEYVNSTTKSITHEGLADKNLRILKKGTLIYSIFASLGKTAILNIDATTNQAILGLITTNKIDDYYLKYYLNALQTTISSFSNENTQENLNTNIVKNMEIAIPIGLKEQKQMANFLDKKIAKIEETITKNQQLIQLLEEKRIALINLVVTKGLNPDVPLKDSGVEWIGEIPEHWNIIKLKNCSNIINDKKDFADETDKYVGLEHIESETGKLLNYSIEGADGTVNKFKKDMVLFGKLRPYLAKVINTSFEGVCSTELLVFKTDKSLISKYLFYFMLSNRFIEQVNSSTYGVKMPRASPDFINNLTIAFPSTLEQKNIVNYLDSKITKINIIISKIKENIAFLEEYITSLIYHVVTGKIKVSD